MALLEWKAEYSVGNAAVDHEHAQLIERINALYTQLGNPLDTSRVNFVLGEIHADIAAHFALEERLMRQAAYGEYAAHKEDHEDLLDQLRDLMDIFAADPQAGQNQLNKRLSDWFGKHFSSHDARLHRHLG